MRIPVPPTKWLVIGGSTAAVVVISLAAYAFWPSPAPVPGTAPAADVAKYIASDDFARLPMDQREKYIEERDKSGRGAGWRAMESLSEGERQKYLANAGAVREKHEKQRMEEFFKLPPDQQLARIDRLIDQQASGPRRGGNRDPNRPRQRGQGNAERPPNTAPGNNASAGTGRPNPPGNRLELRRQWFESSDPAMRAMRAEFRKQMMARMKERGIEPRGRWR